MKTAEEVLKSKLDVKIAIINNPDYTFNKIIEAMEEYAEQSRQAAVSGSLPKIEELLEAVRTNKLGQGCCTHFGVHVDGGVQIIRCAVCEEYLSALG